MGVNRREFRQVVRTTGAIGDLERVVAAPKRGQQGTEAQSMETGRRTTERREREKKEKRKPDKCRGSMMAEPNR